MNKKSTQCIVVFIGMVGSRVVASQKPLDVSTPPLSRESSRELSSSSREASLFAWSPPGTSRALSSLTLDTSSNARTDSTQSATSSPASTSTSSPGSSPFQKLMRLFSKKTTTSELAPATADEVKSSPLQPSRESTRSRAISLDEKCDAVCLILTDYLVNYPEDKKAEALLSQVKRHKVNKESEIFASAVAQACEYAAEKYQTIYSTREKTTSHDLSSQTHV